MTAQKAFALGFPVPFCSLGRKWLKLLAALQWGHLCLISPGGKEGAGALKRLKAFQSSERDQRWRRREGTAPSPPPKLTRRLECLSARGRPHTLWPYYSTAMGPHTQLLILLLLSWLGPLQGQQHHLVEYMERRLAALEVSDSSGPARKDSISSKLIHPVCQGPGDG